MNTRPRPLLIYAQGDTELEHLEAFGLSITELWFADVTKPVLDHYRERRFEVDVVEPLVLGPFTTFKLFANNAKPFKILVTIGKDLASNEPEPIGRKALRFLASWSYTVYKWAEARADAT